MRSITYNLNVGRPLHQTADTVKCRSSQQCSHSKDFDLIVLFFLPSRELQFGLKRDGTCPAIVRARRSAWIETLDSCKRLATTARSRPQGPCVLNVYFVRLECLECCSHR